MDNSKQPSMSFSFSVSHTDGAARAGLGHALTPRGWGRVGRVVEDRAPVLGLLVHLVGVVVDHWPAS